MLFEQFNFEGCLSYIIACSDERKGFIVDPSHEMEPYLGYVKEQDLEILFVIDTHTHVDHISLSPQLAEALGARTVMHENTPEQREIGSTVTDLFGIEKFIEANGRNRVGLYLPHEARLYAGSISLTALFTPGHTRDSMSLLTTNGRLFSGDMLLIGQCGRTDLPGGSPYDMHESLFAKLAPLPDDTIIYPAHDYRGNVNSTLGYERVNNLCLKTERTAEEFAAFVNGLFPPLNAAGGKLQCGLAMEQEPVSDTGSDLNPLMKGFCVSMEQYLIQPHETTLISPEGLHGLLGEGRKVLLLDVRQPDELSSRGFIKGSLNIPVRDVAKRVTELPKDLNQPIVTICESGLRSAHAALYLRAYGYNNVKNLEYGIRGWRTEGFPIAYPG